MKNNTYNKTNPLKRAELWYQDLEDANLWHGPQGVIVNTAALKDREYYYTIVRVSSHPAYTSGFGFDISCATYS